MRHLFDILFHPRRGFGPTGAAEAIKPGNVAFRSAIALDLVQTIERDIERISAGKLQNQIVAFEVLNGEALEPPVFSDAVLDVDHIIADVQVFQ